MSFSAFKIFAAGMDIVESITNANPLHIRDTFNIGKEHVTLDAKIRVSDQPVEFSIEGLDPSDILPIIIRAVAKCESKDAHECTYSFKIGDHYMILDLAVKLV
jgi:hypothetical protein